MERDWLCSAAAMDALSSILLVFAVAQAGRRGPSRFAGLWTACWAANAARAAVAFGASLAPAGAVASALLAFDLPAALAVSLLVLAAALSLDGGPERRPSVLDAIAAAAAAGALALVVVAPLEGAARAAAAASRAAASFLFARSFRKDRIGAGAAAAAGLAAWSVQALLPLARPALPGAEIAAAQFGVVLQSFIGLAVAYRTEEKTRREADRHRENCRVLAENARDGLVLLGWDGDRWMVRELNAAAANLLGGDRKAFENVAADAVSALAGLVDPPQAVRGAAGIRYPYRRKIAVDRGDGTSATAEADAFPLSSPGEPQAMVLLRDMAEIESFEASLVDAEIRFRSVIENAPESIALVDSSGRFTLTNRRLRTFAGLDESAAADRGFLDLVHPDDRPALAARFRQAVAGDRDRFRMRARFAAPGGRIAWGDVSSAVVRDERGRFRFGIGIVTDVTNLAAAEQRSAAALRDKEKLIADMHHRVKNNLQVIASLMALEEGKMTCDAARLAMEETLDRVRAIALAHELSYASADLDTVDARRLLERICDEMAYSSYASPAARCEVAGDAAPIRLDQAVTLAVAATELLANAHLHAFGDRASGCLTARVDLVDGEVVVDVRDDGPGFDYARAAEAAPGAATGLHLVRALAGQLGGSAEWDSPEGGGARCVVRFPAERGKQGAGP